MGKKKTSRKLFETDLRKDRSPYMESAEHLRPWPEDDAPAKSCKIAQTIDYLLPTGFSWDQPHLSRVDSYRAPPLKLTLETIEEDAPKPQPPSLAYLRSKSLPTQRRALCLNGTAFSHGGGLQRFPSYRPGQGEYLPGACGVTMSGPILPSTYDYDVPKLRRSRFARMREALRNTSRFRQALNGVLARMKANTRRSH